MISALQVRARFELVVAGCHRAVVSVPALAAGTAALAEKDLLSAGEVDAGAKHTLEQHLDFLHASGGIDPKRPLLVLGLRNCLVNPRSILILHGRPYATTGERPETSARPYYGLGWRAGVWVAEQALGTTGDAGSWDLLITGVPVVWDDLDTTELFDRILVEASDHSHVFHLPRGNHPDATELTRAAWAALHETFLEHLHAPLEVTAPALRERARRSPVALVREASYLHSVLGVDGAGRLVNVIAHGSLEAVGRAARELGCRRAICVENSGSVMPTLLRRGLAGDAVPLLRAPNFRPLGRVLLVLELENDSFDPLPDRDRDPAIAQAPRPEPAIAIGAPAFAARLPECA